MKGLLFVAILVIGSVIGLTYYFFKAIEEIPTVNPKIDIEKVDYKIPNYSPYEGKG